MLESCLLSAQGRSAAPRQQTSLCGEGSPDEDLIKPIPLPPSVVSILMNTAEGKAANEWAENEHKHLDTSTLFTGTKIRLSHSAEVIYLVRGSAPMSGADNTWFWIVRHSRRETAILLWAGANCLDIKREYTSGYRDVETAWSSASETVGTVYKYDGKSYKQARRHSHRR